jgi:hypothetical protein
MTRQRCPKGGVVFVERGTDERERERVRRVVSEKRRIQVRVRLKKMDIKDREKELRK